MTTTGAFAASGRRGGTRLPAVLGEVGLVGLSVALCVWIVGVLFVLRQQPLDAFAVGVAPLAVTGICLSPWLRVVVVVGGGLLVLGGTGDVGPAKVVYAALLLLCGALSAVALGSQAPRWARQFRMLIPAGALFLLILVGSAFLSPTPWNATDVVRGSIFWLLIVVAPVLGLDAARVLTPRAAVAVIAAISLVATAGFASEWIAQRGASSIDLGQWTLGSFVIPVLGFALAFVQCSRGMRRRYKWLVWAPLATAIPIAILLTGTRAVLLLIVVVVATIGSARFARVTPRAAGLSVAMMLAIAAAVLPAIVTIVITNPDFISGRLNALTLVTSGNISSEASYAERQDQAAIAMNIINAHPAFGLGIGWVQDQTFDTQLATVLRIGLVGTAALLVFLGACVVTIARSARGGNSTAAHTVAGAFAAFCLSMLVIASPVDDHGFGFALIMIFLLIGSNLRERAETQQQAEEFGREATALPKPVLHG